MKGWGKRILPSQGDGNMHKQDTNIYTHACTCVEIALKRTA